MKPLSNDQVQELLSEWIKSSPAILPIDLIRLTEDAHGINSSPIPPPPIPPPPIPPPPIPPKLQLSSEDYRAPMLPFPIGKL